MTNISHGGFSEAKLAKQFMLGGKAIFTLVGAKTRYTFRVSRSKDGKVSFVGLLTGSDNTSDYQYIGLIPRDRDDRLVAGAKGNAAHPAFKALDWTLANLGSEEIPDKLTIYHAGHCGACGRLLTEPSSVEAGFGPICAGRLSA